MSQQSDSTLKSYFAAGNQPTQQNFADLIDSKLSVAFNAIPESSVTNLVADLAAIDAAIAGFGTGVAHLAGNESFTGIKTFSTNPVFNDAGIPEAKVANLVSDLSTLTSNVALKATDTLVVHLAGNESITGIKTFTANPVFNDAGIPEAKVSGLVSDLALAVHLAGNESITGIKTFTTNPVFNDAGIPEAKVANLVSDLGTKAADNAVVHLAGNETITGIKSFTANPVFNDAAIPPAKVSGLVTAEANLTALGISVGQIMRNVKAAPYNAVGDGAADDRAAIQAALDDTHAAGGGLVYLPPGTYRIVFLQETIPTINAILGYYGLILYSNVTLLGAGIGTTIIRVANTQPWPIDVIANFNGLAGGAMLDIGIEVRDMTIDGNKANQDWSAVGSGRNLLALIYVLNARAANLELKNLWGDLSHESFALNISIGQNNLVEACIAHDNGATGFGVNSGAGGPVLGHKFIDCEAYLNGMQGFTVSSDHVTPAYAVSYINCRAYQNVVQGFNNEQVWEVLYSECRSLLNAQSGWKLWAADHTSLVGCLSKNNINYGVWLTGNGSSVGWTQRSKVVGGDFYDDQDIPTQKYGVKEDTGCDYNLVALNQLAPGNVSAAKSLTGAHTVAANNIES